mmetsp:Transcript_82407/g.233167  ORF Transcript_82407/g.233167 Transcript_82407/m.233167 type:complete len:221 (-) Transcript_82407:554-1216(-)
MRSAWSRRRTASVPPERGSLAAAVARLLSPKRWLSARTRGLACAPWTSLKQAMATTWAVDTTGRKYGRTPSAARSGMAPPSTGRCKAREPIPPVPSRMRPPSTRHAAPMSTRVASNLLRPRPHRLRTTERSTHARPKRVPSSALLQTRMAFAPSATPPGWVANARDRRTSMVPKLSASQPARAYAPRTSSSMAPVRTQGAAITARTSGAPLPAMHGNTMW